MDPDDLAPEDEEIRGSSHPVTWLRVQLLVERARMLGYDDAARYVERQWQAVAEGMGVAKTTTGVSTTPWGRLSTPRWRTCSLRWIHECACQRWRLAVGSVGMNIRRCSSSIGPGKCTSPIPNTTLSGTNSSCRDIRMIQMSGNAGRTVPVHCPVPACFISSGMAKSPSRR